MDKDLKIKIKINSEDKDLDTLNSKINNTSKSFNDADSIATTFTSKLYTLNSKLNSTSKSFNDADSIATAFASKLDTLNSKVVTVKNSFINTDKIIKDFKDKIDIGANLYIGYQALNNSLGAIARTGFETNKTMQNLTNSLTTLRAVSASNVDSMGNILTTQEKYNLAQEEAKQTLQELIKINAETPHTLNETTKIYDAMYMGMKKVGASSEDMIEITKKISIAAGNRMNFDALLSAMDGLSTGTVEVASDMGRFLNSIGLSNEAIKGSSNVVQLFKDKLSGFQSIDNFDTRISNLNNSFMTLSGTLTKPFFDDFSDSIGPVTSLLNGLNSRLLDYRNNITKVQDIHKQNNVVVLKDELKDLEGRLNSAENASKRFYNQWTTNDEAEIQKLELLIKTTKNKIKDLENPNKPILVDEKIARNETSIIELMGTEYAKLTLKIEENSKKLKQSGATQAEIEKYKADSIKDFNEKQQKETKKTQDELDKTNKALLDIKKVGMSEYEQGLISNTEKINEWVKAGVKGNSITEAKIKLQDELNKKINFENLKEDISFYERKIQLLDNTIDKEKELQGIAYSSKVLEIDNSNKSIEEKNKLIAKQTELFNLTVEHSNYKYNTEFQDTMSNFYDDMLDSQLALNNAVYDFGSGFDGVSSKISSVSKSIAAMSSLELTNKKEASKLDKKYIEQFNKYAGDVEKTSILANQYEKDTALLKEQNIQAQIAGYANVAGAMSNMFTQGSRDAAAFQVVESGLALVAGVRAVISQGSGDPYTAIARMATMAATVSSLLSSIGVAFGLNTTTTSSDSFSSMTVNNGSGSILGDSEASSTSITDSLSTLKDFAEPQYKILLEMNNNLTSINEKISGVSSLLIQTGGFAFGQGYTGYSTGYKNNLSLGNSTTSSLIGGAGVLAGLGAYGGFGAMGALSVAGPMGLALMGVDKLLLGGTLTKAFGGIINSVIGGIFGKTSVSKKLTDSGIYFADTLLNSAIKEFDGQAYQTIKTTTTTKSWFGSSSSTSIKSYFAELDAQTERQFSLVLDNLYNTVLVSGTALDSASEQTANSLSNFVVSLGKISLKDKTGTQIQEELTNVFAKVGDDLARTAFPLLNDFQKVGEGLFSTLTRVATGIQTADFYIGKLGNRFSEVTYTMIGNKQGDVGFEALLQSIEKVEAATYPVNNNLLQVVDSLDTTADKLYTVYTALDELRDRLIFIGQSAQGISSSMISGAGGVDALSSGFKAYFDKFLTDGEQLAYKTSQIAQSFNDLGLALPVSKDSFKVLLSGIDLTSEAGQELYGRLIILSESFADVADNTTKSITDLTTSLSELGTTSFTTFTDSLKGVSESISSLKQTALSFINGFTTSNDATLKDQIISYNKLRDQFSSYFDENGIIKAGVNKDTVSGLYSSMTSLATSISGKDGLLKDNLISQISNDLVKFNSAEDILKVNIVDGLGSLLGLNTQQLAQLQAVASDGNITSNELSTISGLTQTQKDGILEFASNSTYFSTEGTLSSLNEYAKLQLQVLQKTQSNETANLSSQTFTYGDYIGKQEQIDIATKLGVSYDSAKPLIEKLQSLSISKNLQTDVNALLGYTGTGYNSTIANQIQNLSPYLSDTIKNATSNTINTANSNLLAEQEANRLAKEKQLALDLAKNDFYTRYNNAVNNYEIQKTESNNALKSIFSGRFVIGNIPVDDTTVATMSDYEVSGFVSSELRKNYATQHLEAYSAYQTLQSLLKEKALKGFYLGGYTGDVSPNAIAGIVHGGEHIIDHNVTSQINQIGSVTDMINQYMNQNFYQKMLDVFQYMSKKLEENTQILIAQANEIKKLRKETEFKGAK